MLWIGLEFYHLLWESFKGNTRQYEERLNLSLPLNEIKVSLFTLLTFSSFKAFL